MLFLIFSYEEVPAEDYRKIMSIPLGLAAGMDVRCSIFGTTASGEIAFLGICKASKAGEDP